MCVLSHWRPEHKLQHLLHHYINTVGTTIRITVKSLGTLQITFAFCFIFYVATLQDVYSRQSGFASRPVSFVIFEFNVLTEYF